MTTKPLSGQDAIDFLNNSANSAQTTEDNTMTTKKAAEKKSSKDLKAAGKKVEKLTKESEKLLTKQTKETRRAPKTDIKEVSKTPVTSDIKETPEQIKARIEALKAEAPAKKKSKGVGRDKFGWRKGSQISAMFAALEEKPWLKKDFEEKFKHEDGTPGGLWPTPDLKKAKNDGWIVTVNEKGTQITGYTENTTAAENVARVAAEEVEAKEKAATKK